MVVVKINHSLWIVYFLLLNETSQIKKQVDIFALEIGLTRYKYWYLVTLGSLLFPGRGRGETLEMRLSATVTGKQDSGFYLRSFKSFWWVPSLLLFMEDFTSWSWGLIWQFFPQRKTLWQTEPYAWLRHLPKIHHQAYPASSGSWRTTARRVHQALFALIIFILWHIACGYSFHFCCFGILYVVLRIYNFLL